MYCRNCGNLMDENAVVCVKCGVQKGTGKSFCHNCGQATNPEANVCVNCGVAFKNTALNSEAKSKLIAGLLGIFLGALGIHNFYLGFTKRATIQLIVCLVGGILTCGIASFAMEIWGLVEGIMILVGKIPADANGVPLKD